MPNETTGFRSLVEQMQQRDRDVAPGDAGRPGRPRGERRRPEAPPLEEARPRPSDPSRFGLLSRRWL